MYIKKLREVSQHDVATVGGKTASLGEMIQHLSHKGIKIPDGFAITAQAYRYFIEHNNLKPLIVAEIARISDYTHLEVVERSTQEIRKLIDRGSWPEDLAQEIVQAYKELSRHYHKKNTSVAVRSSATAEDLPGASFAGQQDSFLLIKGDAALLDACKKCFASLFTTRATIYRNEKGFDHFAVALSICVQQMVRSDKACAGVMFTLDTETGFSEVITIAADYGLGESVVQGTVNPDEYIVYKDKLGTNKFPILQKRLGSKKTKFVYAGSGTITTKKIKVSKRLQEQFVLSDEQIQELAHWGKIIEEHYQRPMDIEWAQDGNNKQLYIVQARPETVYGTHKVTQLIHYHLKKTEKKPTIIVQGTSVGQKIVAGRACIIKNKTDLNRLQKGDILIAHMTEPDWVAVMKRSAGIVTDLGGRTCHAAIVSRESGVPAVIGTIDATDRIKDGQMITLDSSQGSQGFVYDGSYAFDTETIEVSEKIDLPCKLMVNLADPDGAFAVSQLPISGVGLARIEFIINNFIGIHPMAIISPHATNKKIIKKIKERASAYKNAQDFFVETLAQGISMIAAAFYPRPAIVRLSDFKSNEYRGLLGGSYFEPHEENPMLGWRGASRYTTPEYEPAFALECAALKKVRDAGFMNMKIMVPFVRTIAEAEKTCKVLEQHGLKRGKDGLELYMMVEIPSNVLLLEKFAHHFDGFSIGSNDLTQLTLGVDRDSGLLTHLFDERDEAMKIFFAMAIDKAHAAHKPIGICGQAPSDYPEIADFLIKHKIDSISLNKDAILPFIMRYKK